MAEWGSFWANGFAEDANSATAAADSVTVTGDVNPHVKGTYAQVVASSAFAAGGLLVHVGPTTTNAPWALDLAVGGSGSERIIFPDYMFGGQTRLPHGFYAPCAVSSGSRIAARVTSSGSGLSTRIYVTLLAPSPFGFPADAGNVAYLGPTPSSATTYGTLITPGNGTFSSWVQLSSSTPFDAKAIMVNTHSGEDTAPTASTFQWQIGVGAAASEVVIVDKVVAFAGGASDSEGPGPSYWMPCQIPAGQRVSARALDTGSGDSWNLGCWIFG